MKQQRIFITGTDTHVGKTHISCALVRYFQQQGISAVGLKPIASGCQQTPDGLRSGDALALQQASNARYPYEIINPFAIEPPIAPHLGDEDLSVTNLRTWLRYDFKEELVIIEGVGGWLVPLNDTETVADFVAAESLPVILVVAMRLGCLNHALLTVQAIQQAGVKLIGWVANQSDREPMDCLSENIETLRYRINAPCLGVVPFGGSAEHFLSITLPH